MYRLAFTLVELAVVLVVIGLIAGGSISIGTVVVDKARYETTHDKLNELKNVLNDYHDRHGRLPCPASRSVDISDATFGRESVTYMATPGDPTSTEVSCHTEGDSVVPTGTARVETASGNVVVRIGTLPVRDMMLPDTMIQDEFGNRLAYAVVEGLTDREQFKATLDLMDANEGITVLDGSSAVILDNAGYVIVSHGINERGAYSYENAKAGPACSSTTLEGENCDDDTIFVDASLAMNASGGAYNDDLVRWDEFALKVAAATECYSGETHPDKLCYLPYEVVSVSTIVEDPGAWHTKVCGMEYESERFIRQGNPECVNGKWSCVPFETTTKSTDPTVNTVSYGHSANYAMALDLRAFNLPVEMLNPSDSFPAEYTSCVENITYDITGEGDDCDDTYAGSVTYDFAFNSTIVNTSNTCWAGTKP